VAYKDRALQRRICEARGRWVRDPRMWGLPLSAAKRLALEDRLVSVPDGVGSGQEVYHGKPDGKHREKPTDISQDASGGLS